MKHIYCYQNCQIRKIVSNHTFILLYRTILQDLVPNLPNISFDLNLVDLSVLKQLTCEYIFGSVQYKTHDEHLREIVTTRTPGCGSVGQSGGPTTKAEKTLPLPLPLPTPYFTVKIGDTAGWESGSVLLCYISHCSISCSPIASDIGTTNV